MNYIELSREKVKSECIKFEKNIKSEYEYDLIIFVAKGAYYIGKFLSEIDDTPLLMISATRKGNHLKKVLRPFLKFVPKKMQIFLREKEMNSSYHKKNNDRVISYDDEKWNEYRNKKNILIVDDSIDTGNSIEQVYKVVQKYYSDSNVEVAVFNYMDEATFKPRFSLYTNTMINGPWSNDSKYNAEFISEYEDWKNKNGI